MDLKEGWLERQMKAATDTVNSWPKWYQLRMKRMFGIVDDEDPAEYARRREDNQKYGNF